MKRLLYIFFLLFNCVRLTAQPVAHKENDKWGIRNGNRLVVTPGYDTILPFDSSGKVCLACFKTKKVTATAFIKITTNSYACNYLNAEGRRLIVRNTTNDSSSVFLLGKNTFQQYSGNSNVMTVNVRGIKHLVTKDFTQLSFKGYHNIEMAGDGAFFLCEQKSEGGNIYSGLLNKEERVVVPFRYSSIKINTHDSLIIACSAGFKGTDDLFDYDGRRITSTQRHLAQANKKYLLQKIFEPDEKYFVLNRVTGTEKDLDADEARLVMNEVLVRRKKSWFSYNAETGEKKPIKPPHNE